MSICSWRFFLHWGETREIKTIEWEPENVREKPGRRPLSWSRKFQNKERYNEHSTLDTFWTGYLLFKKVLTCLYWHFYIHKQFVISTMPLFKRKPWLTCIPLVTRRYTVKVNVSRRGGSRIFFRRGCTRLLLHYNTNKPHSFFSFFAEYQLY